MRTVRTRFWLETAVALIGLALAVITLVVPDWIEPVFGIDPDGGSGAAEWIVVAVALAVAAVASLVARRELRLAAA